MSNGPESAFVEMLRRRLDLAGVIVNKYVGTREQTGVPDSSLELGDRMRWAEFKAEHYQASQYHPGTKIPLIGEVRSTQITEINRKCSINPQPDNVATLVVTNLILDGQGRYMIVVLAGRELWKDNTKWFTTAGSLASLAPGNYRQDNYLGIMQVAYRPHGDGPPRWDLPIWPLLATWWNDHRDTRERETFKSGDAIWTRQRWGVGLPICVQSGVGPLSKPLKKPGYHDPRFMQ